MSEFNLPLDAEKIIDFEVTKEYTAAHIGSGSVSVLATPSMILFMEIASGSLAMEYLSTPYTTVGTKVNVDHIDAVLEGNTVQSKATIKEIDGRKITFGVEVKFGEKLIGKGIHIRYIVNEEKFLTKLKSS